MAELFLDVVICTYNHADLLDRTLTALAAQRVAEDITWSVLVVDNNCTDATPDVVAKHVSGGRIPGLRRIREPEQGLTPARHAGVRHTTAPWIAFVDDDCLLAEDWVAEAVPFLQAHPDAGGLGGRVVLDWEEPPPSYVHGYGWAFAEQNLGPAASRAGSLVGAGMVVRREALHVTGWLDRPLLDDRIGEQLVSGGDVEIALRIRGAGYALWYNPSCVLRHVVPAYRTERRYLMRIVRGLGVSHILADVLLCSEGYSAWRRASLSRLRADTARVVRQIGRALRSRRSYTPALIDASFVRGNWEGIQQVLRMAPPRRAELMGRALRSVRPLHSPRPEPDVSTRHTDV